MIKSAKSCVGHVFPLLWRHTAIGVKRQSRHSHDWHLVWLQSQKLLLTSMDTNIDEGHSSQSFWANRTVYLSTCC